MQGYTDFVTAGTTLAEKFVAALGPSALVELPMYIGKRRSHWTRLEPRGMCLECGSECNGFTCGTHEKGCFYVGHATDHFKDYWVFNATCYLFHG